MKCDHPKRKSSLQLPSLPCLNRSSKIALWKRLIRHKTTREFWTGNGWTKDLNLAKQFHKIADEVIATRDNNLTDVELYCLLWDAPSEHDVIIPLLPIP